MAEARWEAVADSIRKEIEAGVLKEGEKLPSDEELSKIWGVSRATSHRALHELQRQGYVTRQRRWGTVVASRQTSFKGVVGLIFDQLAPAAGFPQPELLHGLQEGVGPETNLLLCDSNLDVAREADFVRKMMHESDGVICFPMAGNPVSKSAFQEFLDSGKPLVFLDRRPSGIEASLVENDRAGATALAMDTLIQQGHKHIAYLGFYKPNVSAAMESLEAYRSSLRVAGMQVEGLYERHFPPELEFAEYRLFMESVRDAVFTLANQALPATALLCAQDMIAAGVLDACEQLEIGIPGQLEVATFNDWPAMMLRSSSKIHRITSRHFDIGLAAGRRFRDLAAGLSSESRDIRIPANFFIADYATHRVESPVSNP
ncbi:MAG: GntR family transcriptional regulator [Fimbriimonas sp.]|nr:GntR family transcriptional regulator [Fimbriimonas sp.]